MNAKMMDATKAAQNIRANHFESRSNDGQWSVVCEAAGCGATTISSKMHNWSKERWILCPDHKHIQSGS
jgi:hypothetical protein